MGKVCENDFGYLREFNKVKADRMQDIIEEVLQDKVYKVLGTSKDAYTIDCKNLEYL